RPRSLWRRRDSMKRALFGQKWLPWLLLAPQLAITFVFFLWPAGQALRQSFLREDAFGLSSSFAGLYNYRRLFQDSVYLNSLQVTAVFSIATALSSMAVALLLAAAVDRMIHSARGYTTFL